MNRRGFLKLAGAAALGLALGLHRVRSPLIEQLLPRFLVPRFLVVHPHQYEIAKEILNAPVPRKYKQRRYAVE